MSKKTVCYIDDSESNLLLIRKVLSNQYHYVEINSPLDAIETLLEVAPDLIILDVNMPEIDGYQVCKKLRCEPLLKDIPVVFLTCRSSLEDRLEGFDAGGDAYFSKPFEISELNKLIENLISRYTSFKDAVEQTQAANEMTHMVMQNNSESGLVIQYARALSKAKDEQELLKSTFHTLNNFGLSSTILLKIGEGDIVARSDGKPFTLLESELLSMAVKGERIISLGNKYLFCGNKSIFLIKNMPIEDEDYTGRLRDHLAIMLESCDACIELINFRIQESCNRKKTSDQTEKTVMHELEKISDLFDSLNDKAKHTFEDLHKKIESSFFFLGLTDEQEEQINVYLNQAADEMEHYLDTGVIVKQAMTRVSDSIHRLDPPSSGGN